MANFSQSLIGVCYILMMPSSSSTSQYIVSVMFIFVLQAFMQDPSVYRNLKVATSSGSQVPLSKFVSFLVSLLDIVVTNQTFLY